MKLNDKTYDILKWLVIIVIPALTTFYVVLDNTFHWGFDKIVATISSAACTCIGTIVGVSKVTYDKNEINKLKEDRY